MKIGVVLFICLLLLGCGQKGALYLPDASVLDSQAPDQPPSSEKTSVGQDFTDY